MKFFYKKIVFFLILSAAFYYGSAQNFFADASEISFGNAQKRAIIPNKYRTLQLNKSGLINFLNTLQSEKSILNRNAGPVIEIPMPGGGTAKFHIWESSVMDPALAAKFPEIKTFSGQGIDDPTANIKVDFTPAGFHAMIISSTGGAVFIDPYARGNSNNYISYNKTDFKKNLPYIELPPKKNSRTAQRALSADNTLAGACGGGTLRTYRLALAATGEYTQAQGGTVALAQAAQATSINRVNGVYEREVAVRMVLVANNNQLIYTNGTSDPYTNNDGITMLDENQANIDRIIGNANYDIGHVFSTGGGGIAGLGVVCVAGYKAEGVTGSPSPAGDPFDIDYVAHEMGHQFGGTHTFNSNTDNCGGGNGESSSNAEPGSGSTIMAYAGICGSDDLQNNSDAQFHAISYNEISTYTTLGDGAGCAVKTATGNTPPVVNAGPDYVIPKSTPFSLTGSGTDANGDLLTYSWEQIDVGGPFGSWNTPAGNAPLFRSFIPKTTPVRYFPKLADVIANTSTIGEILPAYARTMHFRLTARDNRSAGGGVCFDETAITVSGTSGPFLVTSPNVSSTTWLVNEFQTITWDPAGTAAVPVNCANVKIELSTDGGLTFPVIIIASTPNDGQGEIQVPNNVSSSARIRITSVGNVFYDMSDVSFSIQAPPTAGFAFNNPMPVATCNGSTLTTTLKTASLKGFSTAINLTATGVPAGTNIVFGTNPVSPGGTTTVTLSNGNTLANGTYNITINGVAGTVSKTRMISFLVNGNPTAPVSLSSPGNNTTGLSTLPSFNWTPVPGAGFYTLEISTASTFSPIVQTITNITSLPKAITTPLEENTIYYWRVTTNNACGIGSPSVTGIFKTGIGTCKNSADIPKVISATGTPTVISTIIVPAMAGVTINDLNVVGLKGTHSYVNDLTVTLTSPANTSVILFNAVCPGGANDFNINLDDAAATNIPCPLNGNQTAKPQNPLSAFNGQSSAGTWILTIQDNEDQDGGSLTGWGLTFNNCAFIATSLAPAWTQLCSPAADVSLVTNLTGALYQWQVNIGTGFINIGNDANYSGVNAATLVINNAPSSWNGYTYRCIVDGNSGVGFTIGFTNYWTGAASNAWENPANWSCNSVPDGYTDVIVNSGAPFVNSSALCRSLKVNPGSTLTVNTGFNITVMH